MGCGTSTTVGAVVVCGGVGSDEAFRQTRDKKARASEKVPFTDDELDSAERSLRNIGAGPSVDLSAYRAMLKALAHEPYSVWENTEEASEQLASILGGPANPDFRRFFQRVLDDGQWDAAAIAAAARPMNYKPWVVLVTGLNGIRKTTSMYQPWFRHALWQALAGTFSGSKDELPTGADSFFRQLDYMIATVALEEFRQLYDVQDVEPYAALKDGIFARYRKLAEMLGILLVREAQQRRMSVMVETSGKDIASYQYIDYLFPGVQYRKLVVHFTVNDVCFAQASVETRMQTEMVQGRAALAKTALDVIQANAGGPYGPDALPGVQQGSDAVWERVKAGEAAEGWYKACFAITARNDDAWSLRAAIPGEATDHKFELRPS